MQSFVAWRYLLVFHNKVTRRTRIAVFLLITLRVVAWPLFGVGLRPDLDPLRVIAGIFELALLVEVFFGVIRHSKIASVVFVFGLVGTLQCAAINTMALTGVLPIPAAAIGPTAQAFGIAAIVFGGIAGLAMFFGSMRAFFTFFTTVPIGGVWIGTERGFARWEKGRITPLDPYGIMKSGVISMARDRKGRLWVGRTAGGIAILDGDSITVIGPKDLPRLPPAVGIATSALIKKHPDQLRALLAGRREAVKFMYANPDETIKILSKVYEPLPAADVASLVKELLAAHFWSEGQMEMELLTNTVRAMRYVGLIKQEPDLNAMMDLSFLPADLQKKR